MEYIYPAVFHPNDNGSYTIIYPDLPGCISEGKSMGNALYMAQDALKQWASVMEEMGEAIPAATALREIPVEDGEFVSLIRAETKDTRAVRRTVSIPRWMDDEALQRGISYSRILQDALFDRFSRAA